MLVYLVISSRRLFLDLPSTSLLSSSENSLDQFREAARYLGKLLSELPDEFLRPLAVLLSSSESYPDELCEAARCNDVLLRELPR